MAKKRANKKPSATYPDPDREFARQIELRRLAVEKAKSDPFGVRKMENERFERGRLERQRVLEQRLSGRTVEYGTRSMLEGIKGWMRGGGGNRLTGR
jgi:hypothetical protein